MSKIQGTVKWFSNKKGFGFITPTSEDSPTTDDIFVHQSGIVSEGYRTLGEGWIVEFEVTNDDDGKLKAENVTAPGGGPCTGPRRQRRRNNANNNEEHGDGTNVENNEHASAPKEKKEPKPPQPMWHDTLTADVKSSMDAKSIKYVTGTIDVAVGSGARIKLGTSGYTSMAHSDAILAEGTFTFDENGSVVLTWERAIKFEGGAWVVADTATLTGTFELTSDEVGPVGVDETAETLMGDGPTDPKEAFEANGFQMRRVVLTSPRRRGRKASGHKNNGTN